MRHYNQESIGLSETQGIVLALLPIPSAMLSIFGSTVILYMAKKSREKRNWTPYTRLLIGLSIFDIFSSITMAASTFLRPSDSHGAWSFGNDASCSSIGFFTQASHSSACYSAMLSFYFLMTARFGLKNDYIAKWFEPWMHVISIGYFLGTAIVGAALGVFADTSVGHGCWVSLTVTNPYLLSGHLYSYIMFSISKLQVNDYPPNCGHEPGQSGEDCMALTIGWTFYGYPSILIFVSLLLNNLVIYVFVRRQTRPLQQKQTWSCIATPVSSLADGSSNTPSDEFAVPVDPEKTGLESSGQETTSPSASRQNKHQLRRLRLVSSQAFLFVASYVLVSFWVALMAITEQQGHGEENELTVAGKIYPIMVLNAIFMPLQGFLNLLVHIRPKYLKCRYQYPRETRLWAARRAIFCENIHPTQHGAPSPAEPSAEIAAEEHMEDIEAPLPLPSNAHFLGDMTSSLTVSHGDFENATDVNRDDRWAGSKCREQIPWVPVKRPSRRFHLQESSSLEVISEISASIFEPITEIELSNSYPRKKTNGGRIFRAGSKKSKNTFTRPTGESERRWGSSGAGTNPYSTRLTAPTRMDSTSECTMSPSRESSDRSLRWKPLVGRTQLSEGPVTVPVRMESEVESAHVSRESSDKSLLRWQGSSSSHYANQVTLSAPIRLESEIESTSHSSQNSDRSLGSSNHQGTLFALSCSKEESRKNRSELLRDLEMAEFAESAVTITMSVRLPSETDDTTVSYSSHEGSISLESAGSRAFPILSPNVCRESKRWELQIDQRQTLYLTMPRRTQSGTEERSVADYSFDQSTIERSSSIWSCMPETSDDPIRIPPRRLSRTPSEILYV